MSKYKEHTGRWEHHDDDCWCVLGGHYCNRDGFVWSCCGATTQDSECTAPNMHPTYWNHPKFRSSYRYVNNARVELSKDEIRELFPESFEIKPKEE